MGSLLSSTAFNYSRLVSNEDHGFCIGKYNINMTQHQYDL